MNKIQKVFWLIVLMFSFSSVYAATTEYAKTAKIIFYNNTPNVIHITSKLIKGVDLNNFDRKHDCFDQVSHRCVRLSKSGTISIPPREKETIEVISNVKSIDGTSSLKGGVKINVFGNRFTTRTTVVLPIHAAVNYARVSSYTIDTHFEEFTLGVSTTIYEDLSSQHMAALLFWKDNEDIMPTTIIFSDIPRQEYNKNGDA